MKFTNLKVYYILIATNNLWFITSNWLNFWLKYMTVKEVGIIDAVAFLIGILLEFPSGVVSDRLGRKQTLFISQSLQLLGSLIITLASNLFEIGIGFVLFQMGVAFYSGTVESFGYESAIRENKEYSEVLVISGVLSNFAYLLSLVVGGYLYLLNQNLPNILFTLNFFLGFLVLIWSKENVKIFEESTGLEVRSKFNFKILGFFIILMTASFSFDFGFLKLIILEKFSNLYSSYWYIFVATLASIALSSYLLRRLSSYYYPLILTSVILTCSLILAFFSFIPLFFTLSFTAVFVYQLSLKYINERVADNQRASAISLFSLFYKLPYVLIALVLGYNLA
jgi:MFS family permease